jgi:hypothetical protein
MKKYTLDGQKMTALEFYHAAKKMYQWRGLVPSYLVGYKSANGDKGTQRNPDAPPLKICTLIDAALADISDDDLARLKEEARQEATANQA